VLENTAAVTTVAAGDPDGTTPVYSIVGGADAALFAIDPATGALRFISAPDFEAPAGAGANNVYEVVVSASDGSLADTQTLSITVGNADEKVSITSGSAFTLAENGSAVTRSDRDRSRRHRPELFDRRRGRRRAVRHRCGDRRAVVRNRTRLRGARRCRRRQRLHRGRSRERQHAVPLAVRHAHADRYRDERQ
jgi:hypothetical protein